MRLQHLSNAAKTGLATLLITVAVSIVYWPLTWLPLVLFVSICLAAPFHHRGSFYLPVISRGNRDTGAVALTFDDGPDPVSTPVLLRLLATHGVKATFFVVGRRARAHPELIRSILRAGHTLGNHSFNHDNLLAFRQRQHLREDIAATQQELIKLGAAPRVFRPPVGITFPGLGPVLSALELKAVTFSCRAGDRGNRTIRHMSRRILQKAAPGDIIMLHDLPPHDKNQVQPWKAEVEAVLAGLKANDLQIRPLAEIIGCPVDSRDQKETG